MRPTVAGDANLDSIVNGLDIATVSSNWGQVGVAPPGDINLHGVVNGLDIALIASHWLQTGGGGSGGSRAAVPEPSTIFLVAVGGAALFASRRLISHARSPKPLSPVAAGSRSSSRTLFVAILHRTSHPAVRRVGHAGAGECG